MSVKRGRLTRPILVDTGAPKRSILVELKAVGGPILVHVRPPSQPLLAAGRPGFANFWPFLGRPYTLFRLNLQRTCILRAQHIMLRTGACLSALPGTCPPIFTCLLSALPGIFLAKTLPIFSIPRGFGSQAAKIRRGNRFRRRNQCFRRSVGVHPSTY